MQKCYRKYENAYKRNNPEILRRVNQKQYKKNKEKIKLQNKAYRVNRNKSLEGKAILLFFSIKKRINNDIHYITKGRKLLFTKEEFRNWIQLNWYTYERMFNTWKENNFTRGLAPTIDRIDNTGNYSLDNIQLLTQRDNAKKAREIDYPLPIVLRFIEGNYPQCSINPCLCYTEDQCS